MATQLSVNLNAVAQLRNRRDLPWPSVVGIGRIALSAGAHGLTVHPRPDERHIRRSDVPDLRALIDDEFPNTEFNIEGFPDRRFLDLVLEAQPEQVTLVPDDPAQATSDHGYDFKNEYNNLQPIVKELKDAGMRVAIFCDADESQIPFAVKTGCDRVELYTGPYGGTYDDPKAMEKELDALGRAGDLAHEMGLEVNAGHDLVVENLPALIKRLPHLAEVSIGHGLTADALEYGMETTVKRFLKACGN